MLHPASARPIESKFRILYLGNDLKLITAMRQVLIEPNYRLVACSDREGAVLFVESDIPYDLLLIDLDWRRKEGLELARFAHSLPHRKQMPIVIVTGTRANSAVKTLAHKAGVKNYVRKTGNLAAVSDAVRQLIER